MLQTTSHMFHKINLLWTGVKVRIKESIIFHPISQPIKHLSAMFILDYQHEVINAIQILSPYQVGGVLNTFLKTKLGIR